MGEIFFLNRPFDDIFQPLQNHRRIPVSSKMLLWKSDNSEFENSAKYPTLILHTILFINLTTRKKRSDAMTISLSPLKLFWRCYRFGFGSVLPLIKLTSRVINISNKYTGVSQAYFDQWLVTSTVFVFELNF